MVDFLHNLARSYSSAASRACTEFSRPAVRRAKRSLMGSSLVPERTNSIRRKRISSERTVSSATLSRVLAILSSLPFFLLIRGSGGGFFLR